MDTGFGRYGAREYLAFAIVLLILLMGSAAHAATADVTADRDFRHLPIVTIVR